jgi:hypothetical protein
MAKKIESKLKKFGVPSGYVGITAIIVYYVCNFIEACS